MVLDYFHLNGYKTKESVMKRLFLGTLIIAIGSVTLMAQKPASIQYISPVHESSLNSRSSQIIIRPGEVLDPVSAFGDNLIEVQGSQSGKVSGQAILSSDGKTLIFKSDNQFSPGEEVTVTLGNGLLTRSGETVQSFTFSFTVTPLEKPLNPYEHIATLNPMNVPEEISIEAQTYALDDPLPDDYGFELIHYGDPSPGYLFLTPTPVAVLEGYNLIADNDGNVIHSEFFDSGMPVDLKVAPNGWLTYGIMDEPSPFGVAAGLTDYFLMDSTYTVMDNFQMGNGYTADFHEFQLLPNGHALMLTYDLQPVDMSEVVTGGHPGALVAGSIVQEVDENKDVIFQWRSWDHYDLTDSYQNLTQATVNAIHLNSIELANDGNLIVSAVALAEITKINRQTGEIIWRMAGKNNEFTFINETQDTAPIFFMYQHDVRQLDNGNLTMLDNGNNDEGAGDLPIRAYTRALEYDVDETAMTVTNVWEYRHDPDILVGNMGSVQRLENGNTVIGWGAASMFGSPAMTEVDAAGTVISELTFDRLFRASYRAFRFDWDRGKHAAYVMRSELLVGNTYDFNDVDDETGVTLKFNSMGGFGYNEAYVWRWEHGPHEPQFPGKTRRVLPVKIIVDQMNIQTPLTAEISFDADFYGFEHPDSVIVYHREFPDRGLFIQLPTEWNHVTRQVKATMTKFGEFIFTYGDVASMTSPPLLISPASSEQVDQTQSVDLIWTPVGIVTWFYLQVATDAAFSNIVEDANYLKSSVYEMNDPAPNTTYHWRVNATNDVGTSDWTATGTFSTVTPFVTLTVPNGGETWQLGVEQFIEWDDNIADEVTLELYRNDTFVRSIGTTRSTGGYAWEIPISSEIGSGYKVLIKSAADEALSDLSDQSFSIVDYSDVPEDPSLKELDFALVQNYPNPFNAKTQISYSIPARTHVSLKLYDIMGHEVKTLVDGIQSPSRYTVHLDARDLPTGVYFYRLRSGENVLTRKLVLTK